MLSFTYSYNGLTPVTVSMDPASSAVQQTAAIQAALDAVAGRDGAMVTLSAGTFTLVGNGDPTAGCLRVGSNTTFEGAGMGATVLKLADGASGVTGIVRTDSGTTLPDGSISSTHDVLIRNLSIDGNRAATSGDVDGFYCGPKPNSVTADTNITLDAVEVANVSRYGFDPHERTDGLTFRSCVARDNAIDGFTIDYCSNVLLQDCQSYGNGRHGFNVVTSSFELRLENCGATGNGAAGLAIQTGDNEVRAFTNSVTVSGGNFSDNARHGIEVKQAFDIVIEGASVQDNGLSGIALRGVEGALLTGNTITGNNGFAVKVEGYLQTFDDALTENDRFIGSSNVVIDGVMQPPTVPPVDVTVWSWLITDGNDSLIGSAVADRFATGLGNDTIDGGAGSDTLSGGVGDDVYFVDGYDDVVIELIGQGIDTVVSSASYVMAQNVESMMLAESGGDIDGFGNGLDNSITANDSNNGLTGGGGNDTIAGYGGNDVIDGGTGTDSMVGGQGDDTFYVDDAGDVVTEQAGEGADTVFSSINFAMAGNVETLYLQEGAATDGLANSTGAGIVGNSNINNLTGGAGNDTLLGQGGNDRIDGGLGADNMAGGQGDDTFYVDNISDLTSEVSGEGNDTAFSSINFVLGANVETLYLVEGSGATDGLAHNAGAGMVGNSNNNNLTGGAGNDTLLGQGGNDRIDGGLGADNMSGGQGDDTFYVDNIADLTSELAGEGNDTAFSTINFVLGANVETLYLVEGSAATDGLAHNGGAGIVGNSNENNLTGGTGDDTLLGQGGNDRIDGGLGADNMAGGEGDDTFYVDNIADLTSELAGEGNDVAFSTINFVLGANVEGLNLVEGSGATDAIGNADRNFLNGNSNANNINGGGGDDDILAGAGNDRIQGDAGADNLSGGSGNDSFVFNVIGDAGDTINDFTTVMGADSDVLDLRLLWGTFTGTGGITDVAGAVASGHLTFTQSGAHVQVYCDVDGGGDGNLLLVTIQNQLAGSLQDFTLI